MLPNFGVFAVFYCWQRVFASVKRALGAGGRIGYKRGSRSANRRAVKEDPPAMSLAASRLRICSTSYVVIPARLASTRLPRKLLLAETGKPLLQHTYEAARRALKPAGMCVAADHEEIVAAVRTFGGEVQMTSPQCASGTDRVAQVARQLDGVDIIVNVQGDEPELAGSSIDRVVELLEENPEMVMSTLATPIRSREQLEDPACVKVVFDGRQRALYFSRSPIPRARQWSVELLAAGRPNFYQHVGLYAYRRDFLLRLATLERTPLEKLESLEQLRVLENGFQIAVGVVDEPTVGIDTPEDYRAFVSRVRSQ
jgi:3-deoxy-manno-octulosonate cytidylyltransferase (CMP-KDO synthetase)